MFPQENEVLLYDGLNFKLEDVNQNAMVDYNGNRVQVVKITLKYSA